MTGRSRPLVLVVDDDPVVRRVVRMVLEADDFDVVEASDGPQALQALESGAPRLMILDVMMPGMDGIEVLHHVDHDSVKVLMLTARDDRATEEASVAAGADGFLAKPFSSLELLEHIEKLSGGSERAPRAAR
jgi:two-component system alkaline phosphatase synthesis response regulator PhoP